MREGGGLSGSGAPRRAPAGEPAAVAALFLLDRAVKRWARTWLAPRSSVALLPFFRLTYVENTGAAFGMGRGSNRFFVAVAAVLLPVLFAWRRRLKPEDVWTRRGIVLVLAGAVGNLYDRLAYGFVVDYLDFLVWPVFNLADSCISIGAGLILLAALRKGD